MNTSEFLIPAAVAGFVLIVSALLYFRRSRRPSLSRGVMRRMSRPDETSANDITGPIVIAEAARKFSAGSISLTCSRSLRRTSGRPESTHGSPTSCWSSY